MIADETLFILGAGASAPYGFPTGKGLRWQICNDWLKQYKDTLAAELRARGSKQLVNKDEYTKNLLADAQDFVEVFKRSSTPSIDLFLARNPQLSKTGKRAIATCIKYAEARSKFRDEMKNEDHDWYSYLFQRLTANLSSPDNQGRRPMETFELGKIRREELLKEAA